MSKTTEEFNKSAANNHDTQIAHDLRGLDPDKRSIHAEFKAGLWETYREKDRVLKDDLEKKRVERIAGFANQALGKPTLDLGTKMPKRRIDLAEVKAMMARAKKLGVSLDQIRPASVREDYIRQGYAKTLAFEQNEREKLVAARQKDERKLMDNLLTLDDGKVREIMERDFKNPRAPSQTLSEEFNRRH
jgi:hypothetical protein